MAQKRRKDKVSGKTIRNIVILIVILAAVIIFGMRYLKNRVTEQFAQDTESSVESAQVTTGSISTTVAGSGTLTDEDSEEVKIPSTVTLSNIEVEAGDTVAEGDLLATVDSASVLSAMSDLQDEIAELDEDLADAEEDSAEDTLTTKVSGRVKVIYAEAGDDVATIMYEKGALMLLSLDGYLAVDVETDQLEAGDSVTVKVGDTKYDGTVDTVLKGTATVLISDKTAKVGAAAKVSDGSDSIGEGELYIHESLAITGYAGTVKAVKVSANDSVDADDTLLTLSDTSYSANYAAILKERNDLEEDLENLVKIYKEGAVYATCAGTITEVTDASDDSASSSSSSTAASGSASAYAQMAGMGVVTGSSASSSSTSSSSDDDETTYSVFGICPDQTMTISVSVDESDILSMELGQEATVTVDSLSDESFTGSVTDISTEGTSSNGVTTYAVEVTLDKAEGMMTNMSASVTITIEGVENALLVPADAVKNTSSSAYVYTTYDEENDELGGMTEVTVGISDGDYVEITEGLNEGDTVYYEPSSDSDDMFSSFGGGMDFGSGQNFGGGHSSGGGSMPSGGGGMPSGGRN